MIPRLGYVEGGSFLHRMDPVAKVVCLASWLVLILAFGGVRLLAASILLILALFAASGTGLRSAARKLRFILSFGLFVLLINVLFVKGGEVLLSIKLFEVMGVNFTLTVTSGGLSSGLEIAMRFLCIVLSSMLFVVTTQPSRLAYSLMRSGIPYRYGFALVIALRFVPLFDMEATTVQRAQRARGLEIDGRGIKQLWMLARYTMVPLLASALSRVDALSRSMDNRGFGISRSRTFLRDMPARPRDWGIALMAIAVASFMICVKLYFPALIPEPVLPELLDLSK